jgi:branched-chain amino acid transport system permease protein
MRAIRDNETAAAAMGKDVTRRHLQIFVLGSAVVGVAGAMMTTMDGQLTPGTYNPAALHLPDLGDGDRRRVGQQLGRGAGRLLIGWLWLIVESLGPQIMAGVTFFLPEGGIRDHLIEGAPHMRLLTLGVILLLVLRFSPRGLIPEK